MAISTYKTYLMRRTAANQPYEKLIDIKYFPDLMGAPENLETTTFSDDSRTYIPGIQEQESMEFTANYTAEEFAALKALEGTDIDFAIYFGGRFDLGVVTPSGIEGRFVFTGKLTVSVPGGGVNEVVDMTITITPSTPIQQMYNWVLEANVPYTVVAGQTVQVSGYSNYADEEANTPDTIETHWYSSTDGVTWTALTGSYTGYNTNTLTTKAADAGKYFRCRVRSTWNAPINLVDVTYSNSCLAVAS